MADMASLQATVHGRVHGVFFRASVEEIAARLNLTGYVCNRPGGTVEVVAEGEKPNLEKLVEFLRAGPPAARVQEVLTSWGGYTGSYPDFRITF